MTKTILGVALLWTATVRAELPVARLASIFPPGAQIGIPTAVKAGGTDLDDAREIRFSHPGLTAARKADGEFTVTAATNMAPGIYEARVVGRFGASNPRAFVVGDRPEGLASTTNRALASAQEIGAGTVVNGRSAANAADFFRVQTKKGDRLVFQCEARGIDSKMEPVIVIYDGAGHELDRARVGGLLDFTSPGDGAYVVKLHDTQFRGGDDFWYRLAVRRGPWIDFALPAAVEPGTKTKVTLYGRSLPGNRPSEFTIQGKTLEQLEVEIEAPPVSRPSSLAREPESAVVEGFEYHLPAPEGASNPLLIGFATAKPILETANNDAATNATVVAVPCEVQGQFFPQRDNDWFQFEAAKGDVFWIEIFSQRLGLNTDPFALVQRITKNEKGEEKASDLQEMYDNDTNVGGTEFNTATRDPSWRLEVKEAGTHRVQVRDLFSGTTSDPRRVYRLSIRREAPDFRLVAFAPAPPPLNKDSKELTNWGAFLRRGDSIALRALALRRDGFAGDIELGVEGLPGGVSASPAKIAGGASAGVVILTATEDAPAWTGPIQIVGKAKIGDKELARNARSAALAWNIGDYSNEAVPGLLTQELALAVSGEELAPLAIRPASEKPVEAVAGTKVNVPLSILRRQEFNGALKFKALIEPPKEFEVDGKATNAVFEVDLGQAKLAPGLHSIPIYASSPGRYRRVTMAEAKGIEEEIKKLKESLAALTEAPKKEAANSQIKALEARLAYKDLSATVYTTAPLLVNPAPQKVP